MGKGTTTGPFERRFDGGVSFGGPVYIPKVYNGKNRTFFFFNYEKYRDRSQTSLGLGTVPTDAFRTGDFSGILTSRNLGTDFSGRAILENTIYDPGTSVTDSNGRYVLQPFAGNLIPQTRFDPVAVKMLAYIPKPTLPGAIAYNYALTTPFHKVQDLPSFKIDENLTSTARVTFYYAKQITDKDVGQDGFPDPISIRRALHIQGTNARLNFDDTLSPYLLLHMGVGVQRYVNPDSSPEVNTRFRRSRTARHCGRARHWLPPPVRRGQQLMGRPFAIALGHFDEFRTVESRRLLRHQAHGPRAGELGPRQSHLQERRRVEDRRVHQLVCRRPESRPGLQHGADGAAALRWCHPRRNHHRQRLRKPPAGPVQ